MAINHGFDLIRGENIPELKTRAELFRHVKTGTELLSLMNDDENKVFGITFRTPPGDSTGVPHILEHSVLCGSRKYPVKEPFVELLKGSLQTFLNAMTYPDKTCYPVASQNMQDFYNLIDVYLDAVLYPRITPFIFQQEGWHFELENPDNPLLYKGVVFNEMKGAYSSPDSLLSEYSQQSLFPDNSYGFDSGGDPKEIPGLTFDQFRAFHQKYYHPSNARIYFYGDDEPGQRLRLVNDYLKDFDRMEIGSTIRLQPPFDRPRRLTRSFAAGGESDQGSKGMITMNWLLHETTDKELNLAFHMLEYILLGMPGSPLRKALIDSNYGEDLAGGGLRSELRQICFSTGLKGIDLKDTDNIEALVLETLTGLVREGIDPRTKEAALNTIEFSLRENNTGSFPRGLLLMLRSLTTWLYEEDPLALLAFEAPLEAVKSHQAGDNSFFEGMIDRFLLNNQHRTTVVMKPDLDLPRREGDAERERLSGARASMSPAGLQEVISTTKRLKQMQETPDPPEALTTIPTLKLSDMERENRSIPLASSEQKGTQLLYHDLFTNGIAYLDLGFNLHTLPQEYLPYVSLFGRALLEMGTEVEDFVTLSQRISQKTGGIHPYLLTSVVRDTETGTGWLFLRGKAMLAQIEELIGILRDVLLTVRLDNRKRFRQMVLEAKARKERMIVTAGHQIVNLRLRAHFSEADWAAEQMRGVSYLFFLRKLSRAVDEDWPAVLNNLEEMRRILVNRNTMLLNVTLNEDGWLHFQPQVNEFLDSLPASPISIKEWYPETGPDFEGMTIPSQVNYVGKGANLYKLGYRFHGSAHVISRYLRNAYLWDRIRVQGGAYGSFCLFDRLSGILSFISYRDPNLIRSLEVFDQSAQFLKNIKLNHDELTKSIIGTIGDIDKYRLPDAKGYISMVRYLTGETDEDLQHMREQVLSAEPADFKSFSHVLEEAKEIGLVKVLGSQGSIQEALAERPGWLNVLEVI
ncbi:MAG: insulinase family protein [Deltaproteobacteria bacterium]|nr:insulinase family protein [Deltaproteobacteria bacterium]